MIDQRIVIFTRYPTPGTTKTRLIPVLGAEGAASLHARLCERITSQARRLASAEGIRLEHHYSGGSNRAMRDWLGSGNYIAQSGKDLGERMANCFNHCFGEGATKVLLVGSDIPNLDRTILATGLALLNERTVTVGPSRDGGYYLLGLHQNQFPDLAHTIFRRIPWSTPDVLKKTLAGIKRSGFRTRLLPRLMDIDTPEDLEGARESGQQETPP